MGWNRLPIGNGGKRCHKFREFAKCSAQGHNPRGQPIDAEPYTLLCWTSTRSTEARDEARLLADMRQTVQCPGSALIGADARLTSDRPEETITWKPSH